MKIIETDDCIEDWVLERSYLPGQFSDLFQQALDLFPNPLEIVPIRSNDISYRNGNNLESKLNQKL